MYWRVAFLGGGERKRRRRRKEPIGV